MVGSYPKDLILKDGAEALLRPLKEEDMDPLKRFYSGLTLSDRWFMTEDTSDPGVVRRWMEDIRDGRAFSIVALVDERIVAHATLSLGTSGGLKHLGSLRIMVDPKFRRIRLGTWMLLDLIRRAMDLGLERLRSDFVVGIEDSAIEAAYKLDFTKEFVLKDYVRDQQGNYHDYQIMVKHLHKGWSDF